MLRRIDGRMVYAHCVLHEVGHTSIRARPKHLQNGCTLCALGESCARTSKNATPGEISKTFSSVSRRSALAHTE